MTARRAALLVAAGALLLHLACGGNYGWFRDELYFLACGRRLAFGYVDQPPLIALVSRISFALSGGHVALYRLPAALAHAAAVLLVGRLAQKLGGGTFATVTACVCVAVAPEYVAEGSLLTMNAFEPLLYLALCLLVTTLLRGGDERLWLAAGALTGVGVLNKHSFLFYAGCLLAGILVTDRRVLRSRWLLGGVLLAALLLLPHAIWQVQHGFPMLELLSAQKWKNAPWSLRGYVVDQAMDLNPPAVLVLLAGLVLLWRDLRPLAIAFLLEELLFGVLKGKPYYLAPAWLPLFAMGGVAVQRIASRWRVVIPALIGATGLVVAPLAAPLLRPDLFLRYQAALGFAPQKLENKRYGPLPQHFADQFGWPELHEAVGRARAKLWQGEVAAVFTQNYGEAGALELLGSAGLPVVSGHNSYFLWGVPKGLESVLIVGGRLQDHQRSFEQCEAAAQEEDEPLAMPYERQLTIWLCRIPRVPVEELWPRVKHYE